MATRRIPDPKIGGSIPLRSSPFLRSQQTPLQIGLPTLKIFPRRDLNPGLVGVTTYPNQLNYAEADAVKMTLPVP